MKRSRRTVSTVVSIEDAPSAVILPNTKAGDLTKLKESLENEEISISWEDENAINTELTGLSSRLDTGLGEFSGTNEITIDGKGYGVTPIKRLKGNGTVSTLLGLTTDSKITLHHSGFIIVIGALGEVERSSIELSIQEIMKKISIATGGFNFNTDSAGLIDEIISFIDNHINFCNLKMPEGDIIWDHVSVFDIMHIFAGFIQTLSPKGIDVYHACNNIVTIKEPEDKETDDKEDGDTKDESEAVIDGEDKKTIKEADDTDSKDEKDEPKVVLANDDDEDMPDKKTMVCNNIISATVNFEDLVFTSIPLTQIAKCRSNSLTPADLVTHKEKIGMRTETLVTEFNDIAIEIVFKDCSVTEMINVDNIMIAQLTKIVTDVLNSDKDTIQLRVMELYNTINLAKYTHIVDSIRIGDTIHTAKSDIIDTLTSLDGITELRLEISDAVNDFLKNNIKSVVGIREYKCSRCSGDNSGEELDIVIPLDIVKIFFDLYNLKKLI